MIVFHSSMKNSKNNDSLSHIGPIINSLISSYQRTPKSSVGKLNQIIDVWPTVTGVDISKNTQPVSIKDKRLMVNVTSSVWLQQLQYINQDLIARLNVALGEDLIDKIKFRIGPVK